MKKCLCVRGLKNSPFRVVRLLAEQRQGPVSEICCKDYLVCILYQGTAKQDPPFFLRLDLAVAPVFLERTRPFLLHSSSGPMSSLAPFSLPPFIFKSKPSPSKNASFSLWQKIKEGDICKLHKLTPPSPKVFARFLSLACVQRRGSTARHSPHSLPRVDVRDTALSFRLTQDIFFKLEL